jgi:hypothetical protein
VVKREGTLLCLYFTATRVGKGRALVATEAMRLAPASATARVKKAEALCGLHNGGWLSLLTPHCGVAMNGNALRGLNPAINSTVAAGLPPRYGRTAFKVGRIVD